MREGLREGGSDASLHSQKRHAPSLTFTDEVGEAVRKVEAGMPPKVAFVVRGWRWYPPEREARYLLRLTDFCIEPASL